MLIFSDYVLYNFSRTFESQEKKEIGLTWFSDSWLIFRIIV